MIILLFSEKSLSLGLKTTQRMDVFFEKKISPYTRYSTFYEHISTEHGDSKKHKNTNH